MILLFETKKYNKVDVTEFSKRRLMSLFDMISEKLNDEETSSMVAKSVGTTPDKVRG